MFGSNPWHLVIVTFVVAVTTYFMYMIWIRTQYPPGPWPLPLVGNLYQLSPKAHIDLARLSKKYGPVFTAWFGSVPNIIICNQAAAKEAMIEKGKDFAGRAMDVYPFNTIYHGNEDMVTRQYDEKLKILRGISSSFMKPAINQGLSIESIIQKEASEMVKALKEMEGRLFDPSAILTLAVSNIIMTLVVSTRFENLRDPGFVHWMKVLEKFLDTFRKGTVATVFPVMAYLQPGFMKEVEETCTALDDFLDGYVRKHESTYQDGATRDLMDMTLKQQADLKADPSSPVQLTRTNCSLLLFNMLIGGAETNIKTTLWAIIMLIRYPEVQQRVQKELDGYLIKKAGNHKEESEMKAWVQLSDKPHLPYFNAFIHEVLRYCPLVPLAAPHRTGKDTTLASYPIPKGTTVSLNVYAIHRASEDWKKADEFVPERFLDSNLEFNKTKAKTLITFGSGPRSCIGKNLAKMELFVFLANILRNFEFFCDNVNDVPTLEDGELGVTYSPKPFSVKIRSRCHDF